jgi:pimeloyl-ACP methyl ester carboxylesterase
LSSAPGRRRVRKREFTAPDFSRGHALPRSVFVAFALIALLLLGSDALGVRLRAIGLLLRFGRAAPATPAAPAPLGDTLGRSRDAALESMTRGLESLALNDVDEATIELRLERGLTRSRVYEPRGRASPPALVLNHGVHRLGIDEPRLVGLARALSAAGLRVLTPQLDGLADYHIDGADADTIGQSAIAFAAWSGRAQVGVLGVSFAGGLGLLAALDERYQNAFAFVGTLGAYYDLSQTLRFLATNEARGPSGDEPKLVAHDYGVFVLAYDHADEFFAPADREPAREALRLRLHERHEESKAAAKNPALSPEAASTLQRLFEGWDAPLRQLLLASIETNRARLDALSPRERLRGLRSKAFLLHSADDNVIPPTETEWLARAIPPEKLGAVLLSSALAHANLKSGASSERLALVEFMAAFLDAAAHEPLARPNP